MDVQLERVRLATKSLAPTRTYICGFRGVIGKFDVLVLKGLLVLETKQLVSGDIQSRAVKQVMNGGIGIRRGILFFLLLY